MFQRCDIAEEAAARQLGTVPLTEPTMRHLLACLAAAVSIASCTPDATEPDAGGDGLAPLQRWSDARTWPGGTVPGGDAAVEIPAGQRVLLDVSPPPLRSLTVEGELVADATRDLSLTAGWIMVHGAIRFGTVDRPYRKRAVITLNGPAADDIMGMGARGFGVMGGVLELFGEPRESWTTLDANAPAGATTLVLATAPAWRAGDRLVVASTDLDPLQAEEVTVASIQGRTVTLSAPLRYAHWGTVQTYDGRPVDERAEVGLLSHNITVQGDPLDASGLGGHIMVMQGGQLRLDGVEVTRMGQKKLLARYPVHWHLSGPVTDQYVKRSAIWKSFNRCVTIHGTDQVRLEGNVCHDHLGHGIFLEDGAERNNVIEGNLVLTTRQPATGEQLLASDLTPASFWITNPDNTWRGNVAAGSRGFGFWFAMPDQPTGLSTGALLYPRRTPLREFRDNVAHSNRNTGLNVDGGARPDGTTETYSYRPRQVPAAESPAVVAVFENFRGWKHQGRAVWLRGSSQRLANAVLADNAIGATFAASEVLVEDALFVAQTANQGTAFAAGFPVRGYEFYDGRVGARRVTFVNYQPAGGRQMSGIGFNRSNAFPINPGNFAEGARFVNSNRVYLEAPKADKDGDRGSVFQDLDGTVTGTPGQFVAVNNPLLVTPACTLRSEWNGWACATRFVRLTVRGVNGEVIGPADVTRDDGAAATYVGTGGDPVSVSMALPVGRAFTVRSRAMAAQRPQLTVVGLGASDWVRVAIPWSGTTVKVYRDYDTSRSIGAAASAAQLDASTGDLFLLDPTAGLLHLKFMAKPGRDYSVFYVAP